MRNHININNLLTHNKSLLYTILSIVIISVLSLTIVYAALSTTLKITGNAEVSAASWDIYLDNVQLYSGSATTNIPTITNKTTASFTTTLTNPGDYYMFTVDVVNNGSIDAMIDSIEKTPSLTETQAKYLNYIVEYQNGESITTKQLVEANSFVRLKVKIEFRKDITTSELPTSSETLNLSFKVNYTQADETGTSNVPNNGKLVKVVSGDYDTVGSEICIGEECFYVISSDDTSVTMLSKYNLHVGNRYDDTNGAVPLENPTGIQDSSAIGWFSGYSVENPMIGTKPFSLTNYWSSTVSSYPSYVYNKNSYLYEYVENYKDYLEKLGIIINEARLITMEELEKLGCSIESNRCNLAWVYSTTYWTGEAYSSELVWHVYSYNSLNGDYYYDSKYRYGVRPVITVSKTEL